MAIFLEKLQKPRKTPWKNCKKSENKTWKNCKKAKKRLGKTASV